MKEMRGENLTTNLLTVCLSVFVTIIIVALVYNTVVTSIKRTKIARTLETRRVEAIANGETVKYYAIEEGLEEIKQRAIKPIAVIDRTDSKGRAIVTRVYVASTGKLMVVNSITSTQETFTPYFFTEGLTVDGVIDWFLSDWDSKITF